MNLEQEILQQMQVAMSKAIQENLIAYNSPLRKLTDRVIEENSEELHDVMNNAFKKVIQTGEFKATILQEFEHKVAKLLVSQLSGQVEKAVNALKQDAKMKAKMILAIEDIIDNNLIK